MSKDSTTPYQRCIPDRQSLPPELTALRCWLPFRYQRTPGKKPGKPPFVPRTNSMRGWRDPANWLSFDEAFDYAEGNGCDGLGIVLSASERLAGGDLDHCRDIATGELTADARAILEAADTYAEVSPGLNGLRFLFFGSFDGHTGNDGHREFYETARFLTITGNHLDEISPFAIEERDLTELGRKYFPTKASATEGTNAPAEFEQVDISELRIPARAKHVIETGDCSGYKGDRSKAVYGIAKDLLRAGLTDAQAASVLVDPAHGISAAALERRSGDIASAMQWALKYAVAPARRAMASEEPKAKVEQDDAPPALIDVDMTRLGGVAIPAPRFIMKPLIPRGEATLLGGHGGAGKSVLALTWAAHIATGRAWADLDIEPGKVLFVSLEDPGDVVLYRLQRIAETYRLNPATISENLRIIDGTEGDAALATEVSEFGTRSLVLTNVFRDLATRAKGFDLVVVDNASDAFDGDENSRRQVRAFIKALARMVRKHSAAVLLLAHIDKNAAKFGSFGNSYSGSTAWHNSVRSRVALICQEESITLAHEKLNHGKELDQPIALSWTNTGVLVPGASSLADTRIEATDAGVLAALVAADSAGDIVSTSRSGPATAWHTLSAYEELPAALRSKKGKPELDASLVRLAKAGKIARESYTTGARHQREKWSVCANAPMCANDGSDDISTSAHPMRQYMRIGGVGDISAQTWASIIGAPGGITHPTLAQKTAAHFGTDASGADRAILRALQSGVITIDADKRYRLAPITATTATPGA